MLAAGILPAQIFVFADRRVKRDVIFEMAAHLRRQLRYGKGAAIGFAGSGSLENNSPIRLDHGLIFAAGTSLRGAAVQSFALRFSFGELSFGPALRVVDSSLGVGRRKQQTEQRSAGAHGASTCIRTLQSRT